MHEDHDLAVPLDQIYCYDTKRIPSLHMNDSQQLFCNSLVSPHCAKLKQDIFLVLIAKGHLLTYIFPHEYRTFQC